MIKHMASLGAVMAAGILAYYRVPGWGWFLLVAVLVA